MLVTALSLAALLAPPHYSPRSVQLDGRRIRPVASVQAATRDASPAAAGPDDEDTRDASPAAAGPDGLWRVRAFDYTCISNGQPFVAPNWLSEELLQALRADARALLQAGKFVDADETLGKRLKLSCSERDWSAPGEDGPSDARAATKRLFDALLVELERVLGRRLSLDGYGAQVKYAIGKSGEPLAFHVDQRHEALRGAHEDHHGEQTRRSLGWLLYLSDDGWDEPGGSGSGGNLLCYPRHDAVGECGVHDGNLQVGWIDRVSRGESNHSRVALPLASRLISSAPFIGCQGAVGQSQSSWTAGLCPKACRGGRCRSSRANGPQSIRVKRNCGQP